MSAKYQSGKLARWSDTIAKFDLDIQYWLAQNIWMLMQYHDIQQVLANTAAEKSDQATEVMNQVESKEDPTTEEDTMEMASCS